MPATNRQLALGTLVAWDSAGTTTFVTIGACLEVQPAESETEMGDATCLEDTREQMTPGIKKATELSFTCMWKNGGTIYESLKTAQDAKTEANWRLTWPFATPKTETSKGYIKKISRPKMTTKEYLRCEVTIVTTEEPTIA